MIRFCLYFVCIFFVFNGGNEELKILKKAKEKYSFFQDFVNRDGLKDSELIIVFDFIKNPEKYFKSIQKMSSYKIFKTMEILDHLAEIDVESKHFDKTDF